MYHFLHTITAPAAAINGRAVQCFLLSLLAVVSASITDVHASKQGRLIIDTATVPVYDRSMTVFGFRLSGPRLTAPVIFESGSRDQWVSAPLDAGRYLLEQRTLSSNWQFSDIDCGSKQVWSGTLIVDAGETVRCTVTNTRAGRVVVKSRTQPADSIADFDFSLIDATGTARTVTVEPDGTANFIAHAGSYTLRENRRDGWATQIVCESGDQGALSRRVIVAPGATVVCTAVNTYVPLAEPGISIDISPEDQAAVAGTTANFTVSVSNTGNVDLSNIAIANSDVSTCNRTIDRIRAAAPPVVYTCTQENLQSGITNRISAMSMEGANAYNTARVYIVNRLNPLVRVLVDANPNSVEIGNAVQFTVQVINAGNTPLTDIRLDAPLVPGCERTIAKIPVGNRTSFQCTRWSAARSFDNVVTATSFEGATGSGRASVEVISRKQTKH